MVGVVQIPRDKRREYPTVCVCLGLKMMVAEPSGTKIVFLDAKNQGYVFNPINDTLVLIRDMPPA